MQVKGENSAEYKIQDIIGIIWNPICDLRASWPIVEAEGVRERPLMREP